MSPKAVSGASPLKDPVEVLNVNQSGFSEMLKVRLSPLLSNEVGVKDKVSPTLISDISPEIVGG